MNALLIKERYKVTCVLYAEASYAALQAVDIQSREKRLYLLNVYEKGYLKPYIRSFHDLRGCGDFRELFLWEESLVAVFAFRQGVPIDQVFYQGAQADWRLRLKLTGDLFQQVLRMSDYPPQISCAALLSENVRIFPEEERLGLNFLVRPLEEMDRRELVFLLGDQVKKLLPIRWESPREERDFVRVLCRGGDRSPVAAYSRWAAAEPEIRAAYEENERREGLNRVLHLLSMNLRDWTEVHFRRRRR